MAAESPFGGPHPMHGSNPMHGSKPPCIYIWYIAMCYEYMMTIFLLVL